MNEEICMVFFKKPIPTEVKQRLKDRDPSTTLRLSKHAILLKESYPAVEKVVRLLVPDYDNKDEMDAFVVFKVNGTYEGFYDQELWEWLETATPESAASE